MSCVILKVAHIQFGSIIDSWYKNHPDLNHESYETQRQALDTAGYLKADSFAESMTELKYKVHEVAADHKHLQKAWARDQDVLYDAVNWQRDILLAQIKHFKPEIICFQDVHTLDYDVRKHLKKRFAFIKLVVLFKGFPGSFNSLDDIDILFARTPGMVKQFKNAGVENTHLLYHAFEPAIIDQVQSLVAKDKDKIPFSFVGSSGFRFDYSHQLRYALLKSLGEHTPIQMYLDERYEYDWPSTCGRYCLPTRAQVRYWVWKMCKRFGMQLNDASLQKLLHASRLPSAFMKVVEEIIEDRSMIAIKRSNKNYSLIEQNPSIPKVALKKLYPERCHPAVFGIPMYALLANSLITFNCHTDAAMEYCGNFRLFQATGMGACLLTDDKQNLGDLFVKDKEILVYRSPEEAIDKANYFLKHPDEIAEIAQAGQARTLKDHTFKQRCIQMHEIFETFPKK
jgi:spore maturation protein CgeB